MMRRGDVATGRHGDTVTRRLRIVNLLQEDSLKTISKQ